MKLIPKHQWGSKAYYNYDEVNTTPFNPLSGKSKIELDFADLVEKLDNWWNKKRAVRVDGAISAGGVPQPSKVINVSPALQAAAFSAVTSPFAFMGQVGNVAARAAAVPDAAGDLLLFIRKPNYVNGFHLFMDVPPHISKGHWDEYTHTAGLVDDTFSTTND